MSRAFLNSLYSSLLGLVVHSEAFQPPSRGSFAPPSLEQGSSTNLVEGDIAVPESHTGTGDAAAAFLNKKTDLWPRGFVPYRFETFEWDGVVEPVFLDSQMENITKALDEIMLGVPCIKFRFVSPNIYSARLFVFSSSDCKYFCWQNFPSSKFSSFFFTVPLSSADRYFRLLILADMWKQATMALTWFSL